MTFPIIPAAVGAAYLLLTGCSSKKEDAPSTKDPYNEFVVLDKHDQYIIASQMASGNHSVDTVVCSLEKDPQFPLLAAELILDKFPEFHLLPEAAQKSARATLAGLIKTGPLNYGRPGSSAIKQVSSKIDSISFCHTYDAWWTITMGEIQPRFFDFTKEEVLGIIIEPKNNSTAQPTLIGKDGEQEKPIKAPPQSISASLAKQDPAQLFNALGMTDKNNDGVIEDTSLTHWTNEGYKKEADINDDRIITTAEAKYFWHAAGHVALEEKQQFPISKEDKVVLANLFKEKKSQLLANRDPKDNYSFILKIDALASDMIKAGLLKEALTLTWLIDHEYYKTGVQKKAVMATKDLDSPGMDKINILRYALALSFSLTSPNFISDVNWSITSALMDINLVKGESGAKELTGDFSLNLDLITNNLDKEKLSAFLLQMLRIVSENHFSHIGAESSNSVLQYEKVIGIVINKLAIVGVSDEKLLNFCRELPIWPDNKALIIARLAVEKSKSGINKEKLFDLLNEALELADKSNNSSKHETEMVALVIVNNIINIDFSKEQLGALLKNSLDKIWDLDEKLKVVSTMEEKGLDSDFVKNIKYEVFNKEMTNGTHVEYILSAMPNAGLSNKQNQSLLKAALAYIDQHGSVDAFMHSPTSQIVSHIACFLAKLNTPNNLVEKEFKKALSHVDSIDDYCKIISDMVKANIEKDEIRKVIKKAVSSINNWNYGIKGEDARISDVFTLIEELSNLGFYSEALIIARGIAYKEERVLAIADIGKIVGQKGKKELAINLFKESLQTAGPKLLNEPRRHGQQFYDWIGNHISESGLNEKEVNLLLKNAGCHR